MPHFHPKHQRKPRTQRESDTNNTESEERLNKDRKPIFADLNRVSALMVTLDPQGRIVAFNQACEQITGYLFPEVRGRYIWDLFLISEEVEQFKALFSNLKTASFAEYNYENCWVTKDGAYRLISWSNTPLFNEDDTVEYIIGAGIDITEQKPWAKELNEQDQRTQQLAKTTLKIRQSLQLEKILQTTVTEVQNLLQADRVLIYHLRSDGTGSAVAEAIVPGWSAVLGQTFEPEVFPQECHQLYVSGRIRAIEDTRKAEISPCLVEFLQQFEVKAKLVVPILLKEQLWGLLVVHQCSTPRQWSSFDVELLQHLAGQASIALAQVHHQEHLEELVAEYTTELTNTTNVTQHKCAEEVLRQHVEREQAINQVVQAIRNSLDLETIFATTVEVIGKLLQVDRVVIVQYLPERMLWLNVADYRTSPDLPIAIGFKVPDQGNPIAAQLKRKEVVSIDNTSHIEDEINRNLAQTFPGAWLLVPLHFGSFVWGCIGLVVGNHPYPWQEFEVQLSLAVADQIAIAIQQAQLLEQSRTTTITAQEQATKLENEIAERKRTEETLRGLYKVSSARKLNFDQRLQGLLALGRRQFGMEMGALGRVEHSQYEVIAAQVAPKSTFPISKGNIWNLQQTYCRVTLGAKEPIAFESAGTSFWCSYPAYTSSRIEAYIGTPVIVGGEIYGTLSFFSLQPRHYPFTPGDKELLKLMAQWVGAFLERQQGEEELRQSEARFREIAQREALLNQLASQIRRSLDLNTILETAVHEIRNLLQIDRCFFLWYRPNTEQPVWEVVQEARTADFPSLIDYCFPLTAFGPLTTRVFNKEITRVDNARSLTDPVEQRFFFSVGYTALLALPIHTTSGEIGVVSCGHSSGSRPWRDSEVELLQAVADQIAIAIDQAELYKQSRITAVAAQEQATKLEHALHELQHTQAQLVQSEKMSSLGQMVAGVAHEINNPINFIYGNLSHINAYTEDLINLIQLYQHYYPQPDPEIQAETEVIDLDFIKEDLPKILLSMKMGADRISQIVLSLRNFSRLDEAEMKWVDIHEGLDNTLLILAHRLKSKQPDAPSIQIFKDYGTLPEVQCYPGQLNQVFMNILTNAIDAIEDNHKERTASADTALTSEAIKNHPGIIWICTQALVDSNQVVIVIGDNGTGMTQEIQQKMFDPFFTTKPVGQGTGLGMSITYQIVVEKHGGELDCISAQEQGTVFLISLPISQPNCE